MPYVNVKVTAGVTQLLVDVLNKKPEHTHIIIDEIAPENWGFNGVNTVVYRQQHNGK